MCRAILSLSRIQEFTETPGTRAPADSDRRARLARRARPPLETRPPDLGSGCRPLPIHPHSHRNLPQVPELKTSHAPQNSFVTPLTSHASSPVVRSMLPDRLSQTMTRGVVKWSELSGKWTLIPLNAG